MKFLLKREQVTTLGKAGVLRPFLDHLTALPPLRRPPTPSSPELQFLDLEGKISILSWLGVLRTKIQPLADPGLGFRAWVAVLGSSRSPKCMPASILVAHGPWWAYRSIALRRSLAISTSPLPPSGPEWRS